MGRDALFGHLVHFFSANLDFEWRSIFGDHGSMQRLIKIRPRHGNEILDAPWHRAPDVVDDPQHGVTVLQRARDDAHGKEVVNLIDGYALPLQLLVDAEEAFDPA